MPSNRAIPPEISQEISRRLAGAEHEHKVRILYCCESGSRAWGFASADSDYDVRFIYVHEEDWYLSFDIERRRDVIEYPIIDEIDCSGWDLRKALYLFTRTNGALLEWLNSPVRYIERGNFAKKLRDLAPRVINNMALCYHYSHMARRNAREYLFRDKVKLKKYFYVLRPLLAIRYIEEGRGIPPVEFERLVEAVAPLEIRPGITTLLETKRVTTELGLGDPIPAINAFIAAETERHGTAFHGQGRPDINERAEVTEELNAIFRETIREA
ncbi:MAG: nucleotidyltransferase domain-containing protein [Candidatus Electrothrix scaldis]|nr:MAG: nucleotidyltransferase domain-containing protein [Candidatus Electrothrix sp. GW3-3]